MKKVMINALRMENFKGIKNREVTFNGSSASVIGANGLGKTTIADAWHWLVTGRDSRWSAKFDIKPTYNGVEMHNLNTTVEADISIDGVRHTLRKTLSENWATKRGSSISEFVGNEISYLVDGVPKKESEWKKWLNALMPENLWAILTSPLFFNSEETTKWKNRRDLLFGLVEDVPAHEIALADEKYAPLREVLEQHGGCVDDAKKALAYQLKHLEKEREGIPARIDELSRSIAAIDDSAVNEAMKVLVDCQIDLTALDNELSNAKSIRQQLSRIYSDKSLWESTRDGKIRNALEVANMERKNGLKLLAELRQELSDAGQKLARLVQSAEYDEAQAALLEAQVQDERAKHRAVKQEQYNPQAQNDSCPTCGQELPENMKAERDGKLRENWVNEQARRLAEIVKRGKALKAQLETHQKAARSAQEQIAAVETRKQELERGISELAAYENMPEITLNQIKVDTSDEDSKLQALELELTRIENGSKDSEIMERRLTLMDKQQEAQKVIARRDQIREASARIKELEAKERTLGEQMAGIQGNLFLLEALVREKCTRTEERINALFPENVVWRLFEMHQNDGISECCTCYVNGSAFGTNANTAAKVNAGLEIIGVLSEKLGVSVPVMVDQVESVNDLAQIDAQVITFVVSKDKELRVELNNDSSQMVA